MPGQQVACRWTDGEDVGPPALGRAHPNGFQGITAARCLSGAARLTCWQSYGDAARAMIANSSPQLGWLAPQTAPVVLIAPAPAGAASSDVQQLAFGLAAVRQSVDQLTAQLEAGQRQMGGDIAKLQADEQEILHKLSATPPRPTAAPTHKPASVTPPPSPSASVTPPPSPSAQGR